MCGCCTVSVFENNVFDVKGVAREPGRGGRGGQDPGGAAGADSSGVRGGFPPDTP